MPRMSGELYDALLEAGASEEKARKAAEAVAAFENRFAAIDRKLAVLTWMVRVNLVMTLGMLWRLFQ